MEGSRRTLGLPGQELAAAWPCSEVTAALQPDHPPLGPRAAESSTRPGPGTGRWWVYSGLNVPTGESCTYLKPVISNWPPVVLPGDPSSPGDSQAINIPENPKVRRDG